MVIQLIYDNLVIIFIAFIIKAKEKRLTLVLKYGGQVVYDVFVTTF